MARRNITRQVLLALALLTANSVDAQLFYNGAQDGLLICLNPFCGGRGATLTPISPVTQPERGLLFYEGAKMGVRVCRDPFCFKQTFMPPPCAPTTVNITSPLNGSTYYWSLPSVSVDINYTITGANSYTCRYRINNNSWNDIPCAEGNNSEQGITMPEGYPVSVTVSVYNGCETVGNSTQFSVVKLRGGKIGSINPVVWLVLGVVLFIIWDNQRVRR